VRTSGTKTTQESVSVSAGAGLEDGGQLGDWVAWVVGSAERAACSKRCAMRRTAMVSGW